MKVKVISPEGEVFRGEASAVFFPGADGRFEVLDDHAPLVSTLGKGPLIIRPTGKSEEIILAEGLAADQKGDFVLEISSGVVKVLSGKVDVLID